MDTRKSIRRWSCGSLALVCAVFLMGNAQAQNASDLHKLTVKYGDLNLSTDTGARTLYRRIRGAARFVCGQRGAPSTSSSCGMTATAAASMAPSPRCTARC